MVRRASTISNLRRWISPALVCSGIILWLIAFVPLLARHSSSLSPRSIKRIYNFSSEAEENTLDEYTFVGDDYPSYYPVDLGQVLFTPEDTVHYQIYAEDAEREWASIFPEHGEFLALGPERRIFGLSLFHQMHCLVRIRRAVDAQQPSGHAHHCINYLRQIILCEADPTLEPIVPGSGRRAVYSETPRMCKDWARVYELSAENSQRMGERRRAELEWMKATYT